MPSNKPVVAAFDFDGTLTRRDTLLPFLLYKIGTMRVFRNAILLSPTLAGYVLGFISNSDAKQRVLVKCLGGMRFDELQLEAGSYATSVLPGLIRTEALTRFEWHKQQGHRCVVISASLDLYVRPWAISAGFDDVLATHLEILEDGCVTGNLQGANCFGMEKVSRLKTLLGGKENYILYAYGDSRGDKELLSSADHSYYRHFPL